MRRAEQRAIAAKTSDNLQAERHTFVIDAARYGNRGIGGERDYIRKREPVIVVVERLAIHFREIKLRPREWRYWRRRSEDNIVIAERLLKAPENARFFDVCSCHVGKRHFRADFVVRAHVGSERAGILFVSVAIFRDVICGTDN